MRNAKREDRSSRHLVPDTSAGTGLPGASPGQFAGYLSVVLGLGVVGTSADAAIIPIDFSAVPGINGGLAPGASATVPMRDGMGNPLNGPSLLVFNSFDDGYGYVYTGVSVGGYMAALADPGGFARPHIFASNTVVDAQLFLDPNLVSVTNSAYAKQMVFKFVDQNNSATYTAPDVLNGFIAIAFSESSDPNSTYYGYLQLNWTGASNQFEILCGAYESSAGTGITMTNCQAAGVPAPNSLALLALGAAGIGLARRVRRRNAA